MGTIQEKADKLFQNAEILAPMVRASTTPLRMIALSYGADLVYTEEIIDRSITATTRHVSVLPSNTNRSRYLGTSTSSTTNNDDDDNNKEPPTSIEYKKNIKSFSKKVQKRMIQNKEETPSVLKIIPHIEQHKLIYQIGTGESNLALPAASMVANDVSGIDINMGCPKKFSVSGGMGSALLQDVNRACDIVKTLRRNLNIPISCKIRLLKDDTQTLEFIQALIQAGANAITIHGRMVGDESIVPVRINRLVDLVQTVKLVKSSAQHNVVPIIINGDLYTRNDIVNCKRRSNADGVMLARPALYNTSIFIKPKDTHGGTTNITTDNNEEETRYGYDSPLLKSKTNVIQEYLQQAQIYKTHYKNVKYVICEMMNNRRTPPILTPFMPQLWNKTYSSNTGQLHNIDQVCKCKSLNDLCQLWDVNLSMNSTVVSGNDNDNINNVGVSVGGNHNVGADSGTLHRYDDRYFLDPDALHKEREIEQQKQQQQQKQGKDDSCNGNNSHNSNHHESHVHGNGNDNGNGNGNSHDKNNSHDRNENESDKRNGNNNDNGNDINNDNDNDDNENLIHVQVKKPRLEK